MVWNPPSSLKKTYKIIIKKENILTSIFILITDLNIIFNYLFKIKDIYLFK